MYYLNIITTPARLFFFLNRNGNTTKCINVNCKIISGDIVLYINDHEVRL